MSDAHSGSPDGAVGSRAPSVWQPIDSAPKDLTTIWATIRHDLVEYTARPDLKPWAGLQLPLRHCVLAEDGFDIGWSIAAPVGQGGFPDDWIVGWQPLPAPPLGARPPAAQPETTCVASHISPQGEPAEEMVEAALKADWEADKYADEKPSWTEIKADEREEVRIVLANRREGMRAALTAALRVRNGG